MVLLPQAHQPASLLTVPSFQGFWLLFRTNAPLATRSFDLPYRYFPSPSRLRPFPLTLFFFNPPAHPHHLILFNSLVLPTTQSRHTPCNGCAVPPETVPVLFSLLVQVLRPSVSGLCGLGQTSTTYSQQKSCRPLVIPPSCLLHPLG